MGMIGRGNQNGIDTLLLLQHQPVIPVLRCIRKLLEGGGSQVEIHITERHDILGTHVVDVSGAHSSGAYCSDVELITWGDISLAAKHMARNYYKACTGDCRFREERTTVECFFHGRVTVMDSYG